MDVQNTCPECGAILSEYTSCQEIFNSFLIKEYADPEYGGVHFLTVACYMIQHRRYSDEGLIWIEQKIWENLILGMPARRVREKASKEMKNDLRTWKVVRSPDESPLPKISWSMTIVDIASNYQDSDNYCQLVQKWAHITLCEMKPLMAHS